MDPWWWPPRWWWNQKLSMRTKIYSNEQKSKSQSKRKHRKGMNFSPMQSWTNTTNASSMEIIGFWIISNEVIFFLQFVFKYMYWPQTTSFLQSSLIDIAGNTTKLEDITKRVPVSGFNLFSQIKRSNPILMTILWRNHERGVCEYGIF